VIAPERTGTGASAILLRFRSSRRPRLPRGPIEDLLVWGSLPGVTAEPVTRRASTLSTYAEVYLEEEIRREAVVRDVGAFSRFLTVAASESGCVMNLAGLSQESGVPVATIRNFYQVLVDTFVGTWIGPYGAPVEERFCRRLGFCSSTWASATRRPECPCPVIS